jgi:hypothetical protein
MPLLAPVMMTDFICLNLALVAYRIQFHTSFNLQQS